MSDLISLLYASAATVPFNQADLEALLQKSRANNAALGITGLLLYRGGNFLQLLEGPPAAVRSLFTKIAQDPRHQGVTLLLEETIAARQFSDWSMGFQNLDQLDPATVPGFSAFLNDRFDDTTFRQNPRRANILMLTFKL